MGVRDEHQVVGDHRCGHRDVAAAAQLPDFLARLRVVAADVLPAVHDQDACAVRLVDGRGAPGGHVLPRRAPQLLPGLDVERGQERAVEDVALQVDDALVDDRRARHAPLGVGDAEERGIERSEVLLPEEPAVDVVAVEPLRAEEDDDLPAVRGRGRVGVRGLGVAGPARHALVGRALPEDLSRPLVDPVDDVAVHGLGRDGLDVPVEAHLEGRRPEALTAVVRKRLSPHTTGDEWASPGMGVLQARPAFVSRFHEAGRACPSTIPLACGPRKRGQFWSGASAANAAARRMRWTRAGLRRQGAWASSVQGNGRPIEARDPPVGAAILAGTDPPSSAPGRPGPEEETLKLVSWTSLPIAVPLAAVLAAGPEGRAAEVRPEDRWPGWRGDGQGVAHGRAPPAGVDRLPQRRLEDGDPGARPLVADRLGRSPVPHDGGRGRRRCPARRR